MRARPRARILAVAAVLVLAACDNGGDAGSDDDAMPLPPRQLVAAEGWTAVAPEADLFAAMREGRTECIPVDHYGPVDFGGYPAFEVHTDFCSYATVTQPTIDDVQAGELVKVRLWHFDLRSPEPAMGYTAVAFDGAVRWEYSVQIPGPGALAVSGFVPEQDLPSGTPLQFHVHNHGINSWNLIEITAETAEDYP